MKRSSRSARPLTDEQRRLVETHYVLAVSEACRFSRQNQIAGVGTMDDLVGQAALLLCEAVRGYRADSKVPLTAFIRICLRRGLHRYTRCQAGLVRLSHHLTREQLEKIRPKFRVTTGGRSSATLATLVSRERSPLETLMAREALAASPPC